MSAKLSRVIAPVSGKGGVLKSSVATNVAGVLASQGLRTLLINLDTQSSAELDLGIYGHEANDFGRSLVATALLDAPLRIVKDVRPHLDFVFGGSELASLEQLAGQQATVPGQSSPMENVIQQVEAIADGYDMIMLDTARAPSRLLGLALQLAHWILVVSKTDAGSIQGFLQVGPQVKAAREKNPALAYIGVAITATGSGATKIQREVRHEVSQGLGDKVPLFAATIRSSEKVAKDTRDYGLLVPEQAKQLNGGASEFSSVASGMARDYTTLATELAERIMRFEADNRLPDAVAMEGESSDAQA